MNKNLMKWEAVGVIFVFLARALLHFVFEWSGESVVIGAIASVNESVWEHFKQGFWPMFIFACIEYRFLRPDTKNFFAAKGVAVYLIPLITGILFYSYSAIIGHEILIVDIMIFLLAIIIGQFVSYTIMLLRPLPGNMNRAGMSLIILLALILVVFTFFPPHFPIFLDHNTGMYGIPLH